jgi:hypothetical protein
LRRVLLLRWVWLRWMGREAVTVGGWAC